MHTRSLVVGLLTLALVSGACSSDSPSDVGSTPAAETTPTATATPTPTPSATATPTDAASTDVAVVLDAEQQAVADAFVLAFDDDDATSAAAYAPHPELDGILAAARAAADAQGSSIGADVTDVIIQDEVANVKFGILVGGSQLATGSGYTVLVDGEWKVHVTTLCGLLQFSNPPEGCADVEPPPFT